MRRRSLLTAIALLAAAAVDGCARDEGPHPDRLVIATGDVGSVYDALGGVLAGAARRRWGIPAQVRRTTGSEQNLRLLGQGQVDVAFARVDVAALALGGEPPFERSTPLAALAGLFDDYLQIAVAAGGSIRQISDLTGSTVSAESTDVLAERALAADGLFNRVTFRSLSDVDSVAALRSGAVDAWFVAGGVPTPALANLAGQVPIRLLSMPELVGEMQERYGEYYLARSIPAGTYGLDHEIVTIGVATILAVRADLPVEAAEQVTGLLFAAKDALVPAHPQARGLDPRSALATFPIPLHSGAAAYYRRSKPLAVARPGSRM